MPRVLVTGIAGFIGSRVADHCLRLGCHLPARHEVVQAFASHDKARRVFQPETPCQLPQLP